VLDDAAGTGTVEQLPQDLSMAHVVNLLVEVGSHVTHPRCGARYLAPDCSFDRRQVQNVGAVHCANATQAVRAPSAVPLPLGR
jgi:hypothetical protein